MSYRIARKWMLVVSVLAAFLLLPEAARAEEAKAVRFDFSIDWVSSYYFRGLLQEDAGTILQPGAEVGITVLQQGPASIEIVLGGWSSFHSRQTGATVDDSFVRDWFEADLYGGVELGLGNWTVAAQYAVYTYPNGAMPSIDEVILSMAYDDDGFLNIRSGLNPYVLVAREIDDRGGTDDTYLEVGCSPSFLWRLPGRSAIVLTVPLVVGIGTDHYYVDSLGEEETVGFWELGGDLTYGIPLPQRFGGWSVHAGLHYLSLGDVAAECNHGDDTAVTFKVGLSWNF